MCVRAHKERVDTMREQRTPFRFVWIPRLLMVSYILLLLTFALDVFFADASLGMRLAGFMFRAVPLLMLVAILMISWGYPLASGLLTLAFAGGAVVYWKIQSAALFLVLILPAIVVGCLFIIGWLLERKGFPTPGAST